MNASQIIAEINTILKQGCFTQAQLAESVEVNKSSLSRMLSGKQELPLKTACDIADAIGVSIILDTGRKDEDEPLKNLDTSALREALRGAIENTKFLHEQIAWMRREIEDLRENAVIFGTNKKR